MRMGVRSLASLSGLRIQHRCKPRCRSQMWFVYGVAVAVAQSGIYCANWTLAQKLPHAKGVALKRKKKKLIVCRSLCFSLFVVISIFEFNHKILFQPGEGLP